MVESVNTNSNAFAGLRGLTQAASALQTARNQIASALRVGGATDDASSFSIAQGIRGELRGFQAVQQGLSQGQGLAAVTEAGATQVSNLLGELRGLALSALDPANSPDQANILVDQFNALVGQIGQAIGAAEFNGRNLLAQGATDAQVIADTEGGTIALNAQDLQAGVVDVVNAGDIGGAVAAVQAGGGGGLPQAAQDLLAAIDTAIGNTNAALGQIGADSRAISGQSGFLEAINIATQQGLGAIVDADLGRQSIDQAAGQARQQLAILGLNIANSQPQSLLGLFNDTA